MQRWSWVPVAHVATRWKTLLQMYARQLLVSCEFFFYFDVLGFSVLQIWSGLKLCWKHKAVRWRLIFFGLETSFEDAMISLVLMEFCISVRIFLPVLPACLSCLAAWMLALNAALFDVCAGPVG